MGRWLSCLHFKTQFKAWKASHSFSDSKRRRVALSCSKELSALLREITSKQHGDFYGLNCLYSLKTKNKFESRKKVCENKDFCNIVMPSGDTKIIELRPFYYLCRFWMFNIKTVLKNHLQRK